jgi:hypothetical protein
MKPIRSEETSRLRQELARLLWRLRSIRKHNLPQNEMVHRVSIILTEAGPIGRFVSVSIQPSEKPLGYQLLARVDHRKLRQLEHRQPVSVEQGQVAVTDHA